MRLENLFGKLNMSWLRVLLFAVAAGVYTGIVLVIPVLKDTSFQDIGIYFEWWVIFAVIIVVNCRKNLEAMIKCFVFFLISQPVVFAVEVLVGYLDLERALYYYTQIWLPVTLLTLPGGFLAFYCSRQNAFGAAVLGLGNTIGHTGSCVSCENGQRFPASSLKLSGLCGIDSRYDILYSKKEEQPSDRSSSSGSFIGAASDPCGSNRPAPRVMWAGLFFASAPPGAHAGMQAAA